MIDGERIVLDVEIVPVVLVFNTEVVEDVDDTRKVDDKADADDT